VNVTVAIELPVQSSELESIKDLANEGGWVVSLVHVMSPVLVGYGDFGTYAPPIDPDTTAAQAELDSIAEDFSASGIEATGEVLVGVPVDGILQAAQSSSASMIVAIATHPNVVHRAVLGSVITALINASDRPVLALPAHEQAKSSGFAAALHRLHHVADRSPEEVDLSKVTQAASDHQEQPESEEHRRGLHKALDDLQRDHPELLIAANDVAYLLSRVGI